MDQIKWILLWNWKKKKKGLYFIINIFLSHWFYCISIISPELSLRYQKLQCACSFLINKNFIIRTFCKYSSKAYFWKVNSHFIFINFYQMQEICIYTSTERKVLYAKNLHISIHCAFHKTYKCKTIQALLPRTLAPNSKIIRHHREDV